MHVTRFDAPQPTPWGTRIREAVYFQDRAEMDWYRSLHLPAWDRVRTYRDVQGGTLAHVYATPDGTEVMIPTRMDGGLYAHILAS